MCARLILTILVAVVAMAVACGDEGTPRSPTPTLSEEEAWAIVVEKVVAACPKYVRFMTLHQPESHYTEGRWDFWVMMEIKAEESWSGHARLERTGVQFTVYEATHTVTGNSSGLTVLSGPTGACR